MKKGAERIVLVQKEPTRIEKWKHTAVIVSCCLSGVFGSIVFYHNNQTQKQVEALGRRLTEFERSNREDTQLKLTYEGAINSKVSEVKGLWIGSGQQAPAKALETCVVDIRNEVKQKLAKKKGERSL